jgi:uncharacterized membrane protein
MTQIMKKIGTYFLQGLLYTTPIAVTIFVIYKSFIWVDGLLQGLAQLIFPNTKDLDLSIFQEGILQVFSFPGMGLILILGFVTIVGYVGQRLISAPLISLIESMLEKAPLIKVIYSSVKDLLSAFVGKDRKFDQPVLVKIDSTQSIERLGFITAHDLSSIGLENKIAVYLPSSYGLLGELIIVPKEHITLIDAHSTDVMKFIVSGGVTKIK